MKSAVVYEGIIVTVASTATLALLTKFCARVASIQFRSDTILLGALMTVLAAVVITSKPQTETGPSFQNGLPRTFCAGNSA